MSIHWEQIASTDDHCRFMRLGKGACNHLIFRGQLEETLDPVFFLHNFLSCLFFDAQVHLDFFSIFNTTLILGYWLLILPFFHHKFHPAFFFLKNLHPAFSFQISSMHPPHKYQMVAPQFQHDFELF